MNKTELPEPDFKLDSGRRGCYYGETVEKLLAAERERCAAAVRAVPSHRWVDGSDQWGNPCPAKIVAGHADYVAAILGA